MYILHYVLEEKDVNIFWINFKKEGGKRPFHVEPKTMYVLTNTIRNDGFIFCY